MTVPETMRFDHVYFGNQGKHPSCAHARPRCASWSSRLSDGKAKGASPESA
jgi:hypothetical protein